MGGGGGGGCTSHLLYFSATDLRIRPDQFWFTITSYTSFSVQRVSRAPVSLKGALGYGTITH